MSSEEKRLYRLHPSMSRNRPITFLILLAILIFGIASPLIWKELSYQDDWILLIAAVIISLLGYGIWWLTTQAVALVITNQRTTLRRGLLSKHIIEVYHSNVRNVQVRQGLWDRLFNVGHLSIASAGSQGYEIDIQGIPKPYDVRKTIDEFRHASRQGDGDDD
jgi:uncharacterized membrane protein YdbT with pleckstrin-like domain